jgi:hypothetical protein
MLFVSLAIRRNKVQVFARVNKDFDLLILPRDHTHVPLGPRRQEAEGREIDVKSTILNSGYLKGSKESCILVINNRVDVVLWVQDAQLGFLLH